MAQGTPLGDACVTLGSPNPNPKAEGSQNLRCLDLFLCSCPPLANNKFPGRSACDPSARFFRIADHPISRSPDAAPSGAARPLNHWLMCHSPKTPTPGLKRPGV
jgi:hypothetical protein